MCLYLYIRRWRDANDEYLWEHEPRENFQERSGYGVWEQEEPERTLFLILSPFCFFAFPSLSLVKLSCPSFLGFRRIPPCPATSSSGLLASSSVCVVFVRIRGRASGAWFRVFRAFFFAFFWRSQRAREQRMRLRIGDEAGAGDMSIL